MADPLEIKTTSVPLLSALTSLEEVFNAWNEAGPAPAHHRSMRYKLRQEWPVLAGALDQLTAVITDDPEPRP